MNKIRNKIYFQIIQIKSNQNFIKMRYIRTIKKLKISMAHLFFQQMKLMNPVVH